jgi:sugar phosphate isomerase/epimerase
LLLAIDQPVTLLDLREHAGRAMSNGFDGVEWSLPDGFAHLQPTVSHVDTIPISAVAMRCEMMNIPSAVQFVSAQLQAASSLGAKLLNLSIPPLRRGNDGKGFARYQDALNFTYELLHQMRFEAEATGVTVALESATGGCFLSPIEVRDLIDVVNSSAIGVCLDVERIGAIGSPLDWIHTLHYRVQAVRYTDVPCSGGSAVAQTSQTPIDLLFHVLDETALDCPLILSGSAAAAKGRFAGERRNG